MKKRPTQNKMFIVRKYVLAISASDAIKKEKQVPVHDVFIDDDWRKLNEDQLSKSLGFAK